MQTIRQMRELRSLDRSNETLRSNRTLRQVGWHGMTRAPRRGVTAAGWFWAGYVAALVMLLVWVAA